MRRFAHCLLLAGWVLTSVVGVSLPACAQPVSASEISPEVFGTIGFGHLANCCRVFGDGPLVGGGAGLWWRRLGVEVDAQRMLGLSPRSLACAVQYGQECLPGEQGARSMALASVSALVTLAKTRVEPYVAGGVGVMWSTQTEPDLERLFSGGPGRPPTAVNLQQRDVSDRGFAFNFGGGVRIPVTAAIAVRSEVRIYNAELLSAYNMGLVRVAAQVGYRW